MIETRTFFSTGSSDLSENEDEDLLLIYYGETSTTPFYFNDDNTLIDFALCYFKIDSLSELLDDDPAFTFIFSITF